MQCTTTPCTVVQIHAHCADDFYDEELRKRYHPHLRGTLDIRPVAVSHAQAGEPAEGSVDPRTNPAGDLVD